MSRYKVYVRTPCKKVFACTVAEYERVNRSQSLMKPVSTIKAKEVA